MSQRLKLLGPNVALFPAVVQQSGPIIAPEVQDTVNQEQKLWVVAAIGQPDSDRARAIMSHLYLGCLVLTQGSKWWPMRGSKGLLKGERRDTVTININNQQIDCQIMPVRWLFAIVQETPHHN